MPVASLISRTSVTLNEFCGVPGNRRHHVPRRPRRDGSRDHRGPHETASRSTKELAATGKRREQSCLRQAVFFSQFLQQRIGALNTAVTIERPLKFQPRIVLFQDNEIIVNSGLEAIIPRDNFPLFGAEVRNNPPEKQGWNACDLPGNRRSLIELKGLPSQLDQASNDPEDTVETKAERQQKCSDLGPG